MQANKQKTNTQTNRQTDRQTDRQAGRQTDRQTDKQTNCEASGPFTSATNNRQLSLYSLQSLWPFQCGVLEPTVSRWQFTVRSVRSWSAQWVSVCILILPLGSVSITWTCIRTAQCTSSQQMSFQPTWPLFIWFHFYLSTLSIVSLFHLSTFPLSLDLLIFKSYEIKVLYLSITGGTVYIPRGVWVRYGTQVRAFGYGYGM